MGGRKPHHTDPETTLVQPRLLRRRQAAAYLSISPSVLDSLRARGELRVVPFPAVRRDGEALRTPLFDVRDLDALIDRWKGGTV